MKKAISKKTLAICAATAALFLLPLTSFAVDKLIVKDDLGTSTVFKVQDDGSVYASGNLGVGTDTPVADMELMQVATDADRGFCTSIYEDHWNPAMHYFKRSRGTKAAPTALIDNDFVGSIVADGYDGNSFHRGARMDLKVIGTVSDGIMPVDIIFSSGGPWGIANRNLVIKYNGMVGIGISTPAHLLELSGGAYSDGATWDTGSSRTLKENIKEVTADEAMAALEELEPVQYNYKKAKDENRIGFIAEDVPELVAMNSRKAVNGLEITAVLTKVVQEQQKIIAELKEKMAELETNLQFKEDKATTISLLK